MIKTYLFDWGDTLMVDFPDAQGKMCDWKVVEKVAGAKETLEALSKQAKIYIATGADDSTELDIRKAFERVGLDIFISGYFCKANLGLSKGSPEFIPTILEKLKVPASNVAMVGDNFEKDIKPAVVCNIQTFWLIDKPNGNLLKAAPQKVKVIKALNELIN